ncbi:hypothetical protein RIF29_38696 [Crotalaria pallida]|uniref:Protein FAR1-RELATED SEQUENCE n=1 Tax=Crotalaria pallida TaxID=3830 RepID=A0AAN9DZV5_CROPI
MSCSPHSLELKPSFSKLGDSISPTLSPRPSPPSLSRKVELDHLSGNHEADVVLGESSEDVFVIGSSSDLGVINFNSISEESITKKCMLSDYEVGTFEDKWKRFVKQCSVEDHPWVKTVIKTKEMWATAYMRGKFFAGFRTTSRWVGANGEGYSENEERAESREWSS